MDYAARFNKVYEDVEQFAARQEKFAYHDRLINDHNNTNGANFTLGHNQFSDWTDAEYKAILGTVIPEKPDNDENG